MEYRYAQYWIPAIFGLRVYDTLGGRHIIGRVGVGAESDWYAYGNDLAMFSVKNWVSQTTSIPLDRISLYLMEYCELFLEC